MSDSNSLDSLNFDFAPAWARENADTYVSRYQDKVYDERTGREERPRRDRNDFSDRRNGNSDRPRRDRRPSSDRPRGQSDRPRFERPADGQPRNDRGERRDGGYQQRRAPREIVRPLDAEIRILPNQKNLGIIIKKLQSTHIAFPVKKFVNMFLDNPQACLVRIEMKPEDERKIFCCKTCGLIALSEDEIAQHILENHMNEAFDVVEEPCEAPSGSYNCVAKSTLTGEWIGAPSHHSFKHRLSMCAAKANLSEEEFRKTLELLRDEDSINAWKQSVTTQTVYRVKSATPVEAPTPAEGEEAAPVETPAVESYNREQAEFLFRRDYLPKMISQVKHVCLPVSLAQTSPSLPIQLLIRYTLRDEQRYPRSLFLALRGAFRHRSFNIFRCNDPRGPEFVANITPAAFDATHAVKELAAAIQYVSEHSLCTRNELMSALSQQFADLEPAKLATQIAFLFQKGHIIEYYNGVLALPETNPKFRKLPEENPKREPAAKEAPATSGEAPAPAEAAAAEPVAEESAPEAEAPQA